MSATPHRSSFNQYPLVLLALAVACGIVLARMPALRLSYALIACALASVAALLAYLRVRQRLASICVCAAFVCAGATLALVERQGAETKRLRRFYEEGWLASGEPLEVTGVLAGAPEIGPDGYYCALRVERVRRGLDERAATGALELFAPVRDEGARAAYEALELRRGARVRVLVRLEREDEYHNPGASSLTEYLERQGIDATGTIKSPLLCERLDDERVALPLVWLDEWRGWMSARFVRLFSAETAGVLQAALLGNRRGLSRATAERFRAGGTFHVLVISGLHISFIGWLAFVLLRRVTRRRAWQFAATVVLLWAYTVAVGAGASVVRAALMFTLVALAPLLGRRASSLNALGGAALLLLLCRPTDLFDPSFQLTFLSVLGIVALGWPVLARLEVCGAWRPTRTTPQPPACPRWFRTMGELLYWRERAWRQEVARTVYSYRLFKHAPAVRLERFGVQGLLRHVFAAVVISASVQLCLLPLLVIYFHRVSYAALLLNIYVGALMAALALVALAALALSALSQSAAAPCVWLCERLNWLMTHSADPFVRVHLASLRLPAYHGRAAIIYALYYLPLAALLYTLARWQPLALTKTEAAMTHDVARAKMTDDHRRARVDANSTSTARVRRTRLRLLPAALGCAAAALLCVVVAHPFSAARSGGRLRVDFLDVGQGDAALVTLPDGTTLLLDGGGRPTFGPRRRAGNAARADADARLDVPSPMDEAAAGAELYDQSASATFTRDGRGIGDAVVSEYLWWRGLDHVDYLLATHAHADHMDGLNDVAHNFIVRAAFVARAPAGTDEYARLRATMRAERVPVYLIGRGATLDFGGGVTAEVLWPPPDATASAPSGNDDSLVIRLRYGARTILLTGDVEAHAEAELLRARAADLRCDVLKVAHHGSKTSSIEGFVRAAHPQYAIISVGRTSPFGHPDPAVVARWRAAGAEVLTTGRRGTITVSTDGRDLRVETYLPD